MFGLTTFQLTLLIIILSFFAVVAIGRICQCIETCAQASCMKKIYTENPGMKPGDIARAAKEFKDEVNNGGK